MLAQRNNQNQIQVISHASRQLKENEKNYTHFLLETAAAVWGMDNFNGYLKGSRFTLYLDPTLAPDLGTTQMKTWNRLKTAMSEHNFNTENCQKADLPQYLKQRQLNQKEEQHINNLHFNKTVHVDTFQRVTLKDQVIITITNESMAYLVSTIININTADFLIHALKTHWFDKFGFPGTILFKQGKVQISKLEQKINKMALLTTTVTCKSRTTTFNTETEQQWKQNQHQLLEEDFVNEINFFHNIRKSELRETSSHQTTEKLDDNHEDQNQEDEERAEDDLEELDNLICTHKAGNPRRKAIKLCRHKLQRRTFCNHKIGTKLIQLQEECWPPQREKNWQEELGNLELGRDPEWDQLQEVEEYLTQQREELLQKEARGPDFYFQSIVTN